MPSLMDRVGGDQGAQDDNTLLPCLHKASNFHSGRIHKESIGSPGSYKPPRACIIAS